jgi:hypothetical protein
VFKTICTWLLPVLALFLVAGCGSPEPLTEAQARKAVLTQANAGPTFEAGDKTPLTARLGCVEQMSNVSSESETEPVSQASSQYGNDSLSGLPGIRVEVKSYETPEAAGKVFAEIRKAALKCTSVEIKGQASAFKMDVEHDEKKTLKDSDNQLKTVGLGEVSNDKGLKLTTGLWIINAVKDNNLLTVTYLNYSATDEAVAAAYTKAAWKRMLDVVAGETPSKGRVKLPKDAIAQDGQDNQ